MRNRCTEGSRNQETNPSYSGCNMFADWYDYDVFHKWAISNEFHDYICRNGFYYQLDKDLINKGNKTYSPWNCEFIPKEINGFLTKREKCRGSNPLGVNTFSKGVFRAVVSNPFTKKSEHLGLFSNPFDAFQVYKEKKELFAKMFCDLYKGRLSEKVESALIRYNVEITD